MMKAMWSLRPYKKIAAACVAVALLCGAGITLFVFAQGADADHVLVLGYSDVQDAWEGREAVEASDFSPYHYAVPAPVTVTMEGDAVLEEEPQGNDTVHTYQIHRDLLPVIDRLEFPLDSATLKKQALEAMEYKLPVHFYDHGETGCDACQALALLDPETGGLSVLSLNREESGHSLALTLEDREDSGTGWALFGDGSLLRQEGRLEALTDEELAALLADPDVDVELRETILRYAENDSRTPEEETPWTGEREKSPTDPAESEPEERGDYNNVYGHDLDGEQPEPGGPQPEEEYDGRVPGDPLPEDEDGGREQDGNDKGNPEEALPDDGIETEQAEQLPDGEEPDGGLPDDGGAQWEDTDSEQDWENEDNSADSGAQDDAGYGDLAVEPMAYRAPITPLRVPVRNHLPLSDSSLKLSGIPLGYSGQESQEDAVTHKAIVLRATEKTLPGTGDGGAEITRLEFAAPGNGISLLLVDITPMAVNLPITNFSELDQYLRENTGKNSATSELVIPIANDIDFAPGEFLHFYLSRDITFCSDSETGRTISPTSGLATMLIAVGEGDRGGKTLKFENVTIDGKGAGGGLFTYNYSENYSSGGLTIQGARIIRCNYFWGSHSTDAGSAYAGSIVNTYEPLLAEPGWTGYDIDLGQTYGGGALMLLNLTKSGDKNPNTLIDCVFEENTSSGDGGAVYFSNHGIDNGDKDGAVFQNCIFDRNESEGFGGALLLEAEQLKMDGKGLFQIENCTFKYNKANEEGGGIFLFNDGYVEFKGETEITRNEAVIRGGGICVYADSTVKLAENAKLQISENNSGTGGGIFAFQRCALQLDQGALEVADNTATSGGGGFYLYTDSKLYLNGADGNTSIQNNAANQGGGLYLNSATLELVGDTTLGLNNHTTGGGGGGICAEGNSTIQNSSLTIAGNYTGQTASDNRGGGIFVADGTLTLADGLNLTVANNNNALFGGGIALNQNATLATDGTGVQLTVKGNQALSDPGVQYSGIGGGVFLAGSAKWEMDENDALTVGDGALTRAAGDENTAATNGGGFYVTSGGTVNLPGKAKIAGNIAGVSGGGFYLGNNAQLNWTSSLADPRVEIIRNKAGSNGGGIYYSAGAESTLVSNASAIEDYNFTVSQNEATASGGGIYLSGGNNITANRITTTPGTQLLVSANIAPKGGGIYSAGADNVIATKYQGHVFITGHTDSKIRNGAGIYVENDSHLKFDNGVGAQSRRSVRITDNEAAENGGGAYLEGRGKLILQGDIPNDNISGAFLVSGNKAKYGGGFYLAYGDNDRLIIDGNSGTPSQITGNRATEDGGAIYVVLDQNLDGTPDYTDNAYQTEGQAAKFQALRISNAEFSGNIAGRYEPWMRNSTPNGFLTRLANLYDSLVPGVDTRSVNTHTVGDDSDNVFNNGDINNRAPKVYDLTFRKVDGRERTKPLAGATFQLYRCGNIEAGHNHNHPGEGGNCWEAFENPVTTSVDGSANDGLVKFTGLTPGDYALVETQAPEGYQLPAGYWTFTVNEGGTVTDPKGVMQPAAIVQAAGDGEASYLITNNPPLTMPLTGFGTYFLFAGGIMMLLTGWLVLRRARREEY